MIQLEKFVGGVVWWLTPTTYIQLAGVGSKTINVRNEAMERAHEVCVRQRE